MILILFLPFTLPPSLPCWPLVRRFIGKFDLDASYTNKGCSPIMAVCLRASFPLFFRSFFFTRPSITFFVLHLCHSRPLPPGLSNFICVCSEAVPSESGRLKLREHATWRFRERLNERLRARTAPKSTREITSPPVTREHRISWQGCPDVIRYAFELPLFK